MTRALTMLIPSGTEVPHAEPRSLLLVEHGIGGIELEPTGEEQRKVQDSK